jgi:hypothetical protein
VARAADGARGVWRDRDFALLETGQLLSSAGTQATTIAHPLAVSARATVAVFAAGGLALAAWGTLSPAIRAAPALP